MNSCKILLINLLLVCFAVSLGVGKELNKTRANKATRDNWVLDNLNETRSRTINGSKLNTSGINGDYKLINMIWEGRDQNISGYSLRLNEVEGSNDKIGFVLTVRNDMSGLFVKKGTDEQGDIYEGENLKQTFMEVNGQIAMDELNLFAAVSSPKRIKFNDQFDKLTMICVLDAVLHFEKYIPKN